MFDSSDGSGDLKYQYNVCHNHRVGGRNNLLCRVVACSNLANDLHIKLALVFSTEDDHISVCVTYLVFLYLQILHIHPLDTIGTVCLLVD